MTTLLALWLIPSLTLNAKPHFGILFQVAVKIFAHVIVLRHLHPAGVLHSPFCCATAKAPIKSASVWQYARSKPFPNAIALEGIKAYLQCIFTMIPK